MAHAPEPSLDEHLWTIAVARILFGPAMNIQAPPNLQAGSLRQADRRRHQRLGRRVAGDADHVNPEAPWPELVALEKQTARGRQAARAAAGACIRLMRRCRPLARTGARPEGAARHRRRRLARGDDWMPGTGQGHAGGAFARHRPRRRWAIDLRRILDRAAAGRELREAEVVRLFAARGDEFERGSAKRRMRCGGRRCGDRVTYVVNRNINYTNVCSFHCQFCAFSKGKMPANLRGRPYDLDLEEIQRRSWRPGRAAPPRSACRAASIPSTRAPRISRSATHQGGAARHAHPCVLAAGDVAGRGYAEHAGRDYLERAQECRPQLAAGHRRGDPATTRCALSSARTRSKTAAVAVGHGDRARGRAPDHRHHHVRPRRPAACTGRAICCACASCNQRTGGFTEFVPLPFVPMETPIYLKGRARSGPTYREAVLMHAVARLALHPHITNIQTSWVKMGRTALTDCLQAGRQRHRRHADEREHHARGRRRARPGNAAGGHGISDPLDRTHRRSSARPVWRPPDERRAASLAAPALEVVGLERPRYARGSREMSPSPFVPTKVGTQSYKLHGEYAGPAFAGRRCPTISRNALNASGRCLALHQLEQAGRRHRIFADLHAERRQRILDGGNDRAGRRHAAGFADALHAQWIER